MACKRSGVRIPIAPPRRIHTSPASMLTFGSDILAGLLFGVLPGRLMRCPGGVSAGLAWPGVAGAAGRGVRGPVLAAVGGGAGGGGGVGRAAGGGGGGGGG